MHTKPLAAVLLCAAACTRGEKAATSDSATAATSGARGCDASLTLPQGFCATIFADDLGHARHLVVGPTGDVYVNTWSGSYYPEGSTPGGGFLVALRDTNADGRADVVKRFGATGRGAIGGTGIGIYQGALYAEEGSTIVRYALPPNGGVPTAAPETIVSGLPLGGAHPAHPFAIDATNHVLYVTSGSASNACQAKNREAESPGSSPCTELATRGGIWRFAADRPGQTFAARDRYATGIRNAIGITIGPGGALYATQHGRDQLAENWPKLYTPQQGQNLPAEELLQVTSGADYGWPYCYFDGAQQKLVTAPEYHGDGKDVGQCAQRTAPIAWFPAHWAPDGLLFYTGSMFPAHYRDGAFIAFHGSWNRAPGPQGGYKVVFVPFANGKPAGAGDAFEVFADGFAGSNVQPDRATSRPVGLAVDAQGALYITDDVRGRVWRVTY